MPESFVAVAANDRERAQHGVTGRLALGCVSLLYLLYLASSAWVFAGMYAPGHSRVMTAMTELPQSDFARFWYVGRRLLMQCAASLGIDLKPSDWFVAAFRLDILSSVHHPEMLWLYPPTMGLLAMAFALLPLAAGFWLWRLATLALACWCLTEAGLGWAAVLAGLASPAEIHDVVGGQNGALTAGLLVGALLLMQTRPRLAGMLAGLLCIKPQMALLLPFVLLHRGQWRALAVCAATIGVMVAASVLLQGVPAWSWYLHVAQPEAARIMNAPFDRMIGGGFTVLMMARHLHWSVAASWALQTASSLVSAELIWLAWRGPCNDSLRRMALTVSLAVLLTPYGFIYDLVAFSVAMAAMFARTRHPAFAVLWLLGGYTSSLENATGMIVMPVAAVVAVVLIYRKKAAYLPDPTSRGGASEPKVAEIA